MLTLLDHDLTDSDLISLLNQLPGHSLLLLEDIDTAGLHRKNKAAIAARASRRRQSKMPEGAVANKDQSEEIDSDDEGVTATTSRVSLSGLLNAIDGVAAPEGHILIMTTNKPHELDEALVRAGRISVRVGFKNASKSQAEEIFLRMYVDLPNSTPLKEEKGRAEKDSLLPDLAKQFAASIPDYDFSPADLQDYLLVHKKDPVKAVAQLQSWMDEQYEERRRREEEKEAERELKREKKKEERRRFREEIKAAVKGEEDSDGDHDDDGEKSSGERGSDRGAGVKEDSEGLMAPKSAQDKLKQSNEKSK